MSELIDIYNADRERTGRTAERYAELALGEYRLIVHVCLFNSCNEMLIQKRSESKRLFPGCWDISAGGGVASGESSRIAAERETKEELGLDIDFSIHRPIISVGFAGGFDDFFTIETDVDLDDLTIQSNEVVDVMWADEGTVERLIDRGEFIAFDKVLIRYLFAAREGKGSWNL